MNEQVGLRRFRTGGACSYLMLKSKHKKESRPPPGSNSMVHKLSLLLKIYILYVRTVIPDGPTVLRAKNLKGKSYHGDSEKQGEQ